jgi:hypothetical protein
MRCSRPSSALLWRVAMPEMSDVNQVRNERPAIRDQKNDSRRRYGDCQRLCAKWLPASTSPSFQAGAVRRGMS